MPSKPSPKSQVSKLLAKAGIAPTKIDERTFPDEHWIIVFVAEESLVAAQSLAGSIERSLNEISSHPGLSFVVNFRPSAFTEKPADEVTSGGRRLARRQVDQLIQLLEARSRTSEALPSLKYVEDPRASLAAIGASRHQLIYGRRGVGKTSLLLEAKRIAERHGHVVIWINAHVLRQLDPAAAFSVIAENVLATLAKQGGSSGSESFTRLQHQSKELAALRATDKLTHKLVGKKLPDLNSALRAVLREDLVRLYIYIDDFYLLPLTVQPVILDHVAGMLRDCNGWLKIASIERLTRPFEPSSKVGLEVPHDASNVDLDVTLEDPAAAQKFLEAVLTNYLTTAGIKKPSSIAKGEALGRLVLASGGVPRDYLNLFASSIVVARSARVLTREVGKEDVAVAAGGAARSKKRDLELDVASENAAILLRSLESISKYVKSRGFTYFLVNVGQKMHRSYELLSQLVDLRFAHLVESSISDQHRPGVRYEAYMLDLSEFSDVRLKRGLNVLDLEDGQWTWRLTGKARTMQRLAGSQLRDRLRQAPLLDLDELAG